MVKPDTDEDRRRKNEFARRLVQYRVAKTWSQSDLWRRVADRLPEGHKFHRTSISRYESGANLPAPQVLQVIAETLGVSPDQLLPSTDVGRTDIATFNEVGSNMVRVTIDKIVPYDVGIELLRLAKQ